MRTPAMTPQTFPRWALFALIVTATLVAYIPVMHGGYIWDDDAFVTDNAILTGGLESLRRIWFELRATDQYYPLAYTSFWLEYQVWGFDPAGSHIFNVLLHALNACLFWMVLRRLRVPGAPLAACLFALHPVEVESVAWITERKNVLSGAFYLAAALAYLRFQLPERQPSGEADEGSGRDWRFYGVACVLFLGALWSKTVTCSLPAALLLVLWWKKGRGGWRDLWPLLPLFLVGAAMGLLTGWMEKHVIGAKGNDWALAPLERFLIAGRALWFYAGKLLWPANLTFFYPRWTLDASAWWQWLFPAGAAAVVAALWGFRAVLGRGPLVAVLYFAGTLFPALGFVDVYPFRYSFVADHFQYLASLGLLTLAAAALTMGMRRISASAFRWELAGMTGLLLILGTLVWRQGAMYENIEKLYNVTIERNPQAWMAHDNLSVLLLAQGRDSEAAAHAERSLAIKPTGAEAHVNFGNIMAKKGRLDAAAQSYAQAISLNPELAEPYSDLGNIYLFQGALDKAVTQYHKALSLRPAYAEAHNNLGYALLQKRTDLDGAIAEFREALRLRPDYGQAQSNLQTALSLKKE